MIKGLKNWFIITRVRHIRARYTARICKEFVRQNPRDWTFSSFYREVCYIGCVISGFRCISIHVCHQTPLGEFFRFFAGERL